MIPRVIHQIWFKDSPNPAPFAFMNEWRAMAERRGWKYRLHDGADWCGGGAFKTWTRKADVLRLEILDVWGGVYIDADIQPLRDLDDFFFDGEWLVFENEAESVLLGNHAMGLAEGSPFARECLRRITKGRTGCDSAATGPGLITEVYRESGNPPIVFPAAYFAPEYANGVAAPGEVVSYGRHYWGTTRKAYGSLVPPDSTELNRRQRLVHDLFLQGLRKVSGNVVR